MSIPGVKVDSGSSTSCLDQIEKLESALRACSSAWLERIPDKDEAGGSSPPRPTTNGGLAQLGERLPCKQEVSGSTPLSSTTVERLESLFQETVFVSFLFFDNHF